MLNRKWNRQVPVYLLTGFLGSGKTSFLNESMSESEFAAGERNLCIFTESGRIQPDTESFGDEEVIIETVSSKDNFTKEYLELLNEKHMPEKILIECNGMWELSAVYNSLPDNWIIVQEMTFIDSNMFAMFNVNMRNLVYDKLRYADMVIFNRVSDKMDPMEFHKAVRTASRSAQIIYEMTDGTIKVDEIEDPLPFDVEADIITLEDRDYAYWYRDIMAEASKYKGKEMSFAGMIKSKGIKGEDKFVIGRPVMTCCEEDIEFMGVRCQNKSSGSVEHNKWARVTGRIAMGKSRQEGEVPVLVVSDIEYTDMPENILATFY